MFHECRFGQLWLFLRLWTHVFFRYSFWSMSSISSQSWLHRKCQSFPVEKRLFGTLSIGHPPIDYNTTFCQLGIFNNLIINKKIYIFRQFRLIDGQQNQQSIGSNGFLSLPTIQQVRPSFQFLKNSRHLVFHFRQWRLLFIYSWHWSNTWRNRRLPLAWIQLFWWRHRKGRTSNTSIVCWSLQQLNNPCHGQVCWFFIRFWYVFLPWPSLYFKRTTSQLLQQYQQWWSFC